MPDDWKSSLIISVYKNKGDRSICDNSRGISLLSVAGKVLAKVMLHRLVEKVAEQILHETQCGFRPGRSTTDMIFVSRLTLEKCRKQGRNL